MISNLIEAKPEELRQHLEEAAGISRYKERRRETENRIKHTKENLDRLNDLREELDRQLGRLQRQARAAETFKTLKAEARQLEAELLALRWQGLSKELETADAAVKRAELNREEAVTARGATLRQLEQARVGRETLAQDVDGIQQRFYSLGAEIARLEESLRAKEQRGRQLAGDRASAQARREETARNLEADSRRIEELETALAELGPAQVRAQETQRAADGRLAEAEAALSTWEQGWERFNLDAAEPTRRAEVEAARATQLERTLARLQERLDKLEVAPAVEGSSEDLARLDRTLAELKAQLEAEEGRRQAIGERIAAERSALQEAERALAELRSDGQQLAGRRASLEALQESALGRTDEAAASWLSERGLSRRPRLGERLTVQAGWETAVEQVLGSALQAVVVEHLDGPGEAAMALDNAELTLFESLGGSAGAAPAEDALGRAPLTRFVTCDDDLAALLQGVWAAETLQEGLALRSRLKPEERIVTRDGVMIGASWLRVARGDHAEAGVLRRGQALEAIGKDLAENSAAQEVGEDRVGAHRAQLAALEAERAGIQDSLDERARLQGVKLSERSALAARLEAAEARAQRLKEERAELENQQRQEREGLAAAQAARQAAESEKARFDSERGGRLAQRDVLRGQVQSARGEAQRLREAAYEASLKAQNLTTQLEATRKAQARLTEQLTTLTGQLSGLESELTESQAPLAGMKATLEAQLSQRAEVEKQLEGARGKLSELDAELRTLEQARSEADDRVQTLGEALESARMAHQALGLKRGAVEEQLEPFEQRPEALLEALAPEAEASAWAERLEALNRRIDRLGPINLAAIEEFEQEQERKQYLDAQNADLEEALATLEEAIRKIDRETRARFKETFDQVNSGLQSLFPKVFGGGHAYLELTGDDLLDTGVAIMARPPGKKNASIHLLSGGEKALTAIALVFSIFRLNPAPFCMLDEVDAPLDDANVGRFCRLVTEMSKDVQFIYITHNKISMEMGEHLMGVTMQEPGVSRLVSVNVEEAAALAG
ncbi:MAG: chromosome segregation protein SMC [Gammaproteobacteria bacterium]|nr:chromosome segregation protein SMC [Gammaproteobacteria bacterium]